MRREISAIRQREAEMSRRYGIYGTTWEEDWPVYYTLRTDFSLYKEKFLNRFQIFEIFRFAIAFIIAVIVSLIIAICTKHFWVFPLGALFSGVAAFAWWYCYYFIFVNRRIRNLGHLVGPFYIKYDRKTLKQYLKTYRPNEIPPKPKSALYSDDYFMIDEESAAEDEKEAKKQTEEAEEPEEVEKPVEETEQVENSMDEPVDAEEGKTGGEKNEEKSSEGGQIDLHLVEVKSSSGANQSNSSTDVGTEKDVDGSGESGPAVAEEAENAETTEHGGLAEPDSIHGEETSAETDDGIEDEEDINAIFEVYREDSDDVVEEDTEAIFAVLDDEEQPEKAKPVEKPEATAEETQDESPKTEEEKGDEKEEEPIPEFETWEELIAYFDKLGH